MEIGFSGRHVQGITCAELCKLSAGAGFGAIALSGVQIREMDASKHASIREVCWAPEEEIPLKETALAAEKLGVQVLVLPAQTAEHCMEDLRSILAETELQIALENGCADEVLPELVDAWNRALETNRFFACLNTGCAIVSGAKPEKLASKLGSRLLTVHVNDNHGKRDSCLLPYRGRSAMDWTAFLRKLAEIRFDGMLWMDVRCPACQSLQITQGWIRGQYAMACYLWQTVEDYRNPETRPEKIRSWLREELRAGVLGTTLDVTFLHLSELPTPEGFLPERAVGGPREMYSASAAVYALLMLESKQVDLARAVLSFILSIVKERQLPGIPMSVGEDREVPDDPMPVDAGAKMVLAFARTCMEESNAVFEEQYYETCCKQIQICLNAAEQRQELEFAVLSFVAAAAEAMCMLAKRREDLEFAAVLEAFLENIRAFSERKLAEQWNWQVYAPLAAGWKGIDRQRAEEAMCTLAAKTRIYDEAADIQIPMSGYDAKEGVRMQQFAFFVGWMIEHARLRKDYEAVGEWARFYKQYQKRDYILAEDFSYKDGNWCFGSRCSVENSAWFCMMLHRLRRELQ